MPKSWAFPTKRIGLSDEPLTGLLCCVVILLQEETAAVGGGRRRMENMVRSRSATKAVEPGRAGLTRSGMAIWRHGRNQGLLGCLDVEV